MESRRILMVANHTSGGDALIREASHCLKDGACDFTLIVPACSPKNTLISYGGQNIANAKARLEDSVDRLRSAGIEVTARVGDGDAVLAIADEMLFARFDQIVLFTVSPGA